MPDAPRVLIVEDCVDTAESTALILDMWGISSRIAPNGAAALAQARRETPDVVLLDLGLPDMSGLEIAETLRASRSFDGTMIVAMSGYATADDSARSLECGCQFHLGKPVDLADLHRLLVDGFKEFRRNDRHDPPVPRPARKKPAKRR